MSVEPLLTDPGLPRLGRAGDPEAMREIFQRHLRPLGKPYRLRDCRLSRVRYRRAVRCVLQYTLRLADPDTGHEQNQWVTGVVHSGDRTRRIWEKLRASGRVNPNVSSTFEPFAFVPDLGMLVQVFPYDRRLPTLPLLMTGPPPELESSLLARFGSGDWRAESWDVEPARYRAELGATLRLAGRARNASTGRTRDKRFYAKVYRDEEEGEQTYRSLQALWKEDDGTGFSVGRPVAYSSDLRVLLQEEAPGTSLREILVQGHDAAGPVRKAAGALATLHLGRTPTTRRHRPQDEAAALERAGNLLRWACPHLEEEITATVGAVTASLEPGPTAPTHRDLKPEHILLDGDRPYLLDLDWFAESDPLLDCASILTGLASMPLRFALPEDRFRRTARMFAEEYFAHVPGAWRGRLPVYYAGASLKEAVGFFRRQEPGWSEKISLLVKEAQASLASRVRW